MESPSARSLTIDLLSSLRGRSTPVSALVAAGALFDIADNSVRVAVARLLASGRIERDERGRYRLSAQADPVDRQVRAWGKLERRMRAWKGGWVGIHLPSGARERGTEARRRSRALRFKGFEFLRPGLAIRPDNLRGGLDVLRGELTALGLETADAGGHIVFALSALDASAKERAHSLWKSAELLAGYDRSGAMLEQSLAELGALDEGAAMVESFLLGGQVLRQLALDPLLPEEILPGRERTALVETMRRYDTAGRLVWAAFMARHGAPHFGSAADTRPGESWSLH
jgi:phenylacetic acid degradation operon negative regulatory protein